MRALPKASRKSSPNHYRGQLIWFGLLLTMLETDLEHIPTTFTTKYSMRSHTIKQASKDISQSINQSVNRSIKQEKN